MTTFYRRRRLATPSDRSVSIVGLLVAAWLLLDPINELLGRLL